MGKRKPVGRAYARAQHEKHKERPHSKLCTCWYCSQDKKRKSELEWEEEEN